MLKLVLGRSGSGKTTTLRELVRQSLREDRERPVFLIVPEQASFENERAMLSLLGTEDAQLVHVLSFSRLADEAFRLYGGGAGRRLDDGGRSMFMSLALSAVQDRLDFYRRSAAGGELVSLMLAISSELKLCAVSPATLAEAAGRMPEGALSRKLREVSLILSAYDAMVAQSYLDPLDDLTRALPLLREHGFFRGALVAVDSFTAFTVQQYAILRVILEQSEEMAVSLCADSLDDPDDGVGLFSLVKRTARQLRVLAREIGVSVAAPVVLPPGARFACEGLRGLEENLYRARRQSFPGTDCATVYRASGVYEEAAFVASSIRRLVMEEGYRYGDFAVIARNADTYAGVLDRALDAREIPYFMDQPAAIESEPLMRFVLAALQTVRTGFRTDELLLCLKTGLAGLDTEEIARLENYAFLWNVSGRTWREEWTAHPRGFEEEWTEEDGQLLESLNACRRRAVEPLEELASVVETGTGEDCARALYRYLERTQAAEALRSLAVQLEGAGRPDLAERGVRLWDMLMQILDQCAMVLGETVLGCARFSELLRRVIACGTLATIPQGLDQVTVGSADRMRPNKPKITFVVGAAQGEFPLAPSQSSVFSDTERRELIALGLPLNETLEGTAVQERYLTYTAMTSSSDRLFVSWPESGGDGGVREPSTLVSELLAILPDTPVLSRGELPRDFFANAAQPAFEEAARLWRDGSSWSETLRACFAEDPDYAPRFAALDRARDRSPARLEESDLALALFGRSMTLSATQVEKFFLCHFQYFCRFGLGAKERRAAALDALEYGSVMHFLLETVLKEDGVQKLLAMEPEELEQRLSGLLRDYAARKLSGEAMKTARFTHLFSRLAGAAAAVVRRIAEELAQSRFVPTDFELPVGKGGVPALRIPLPDGGTARVEGQIDRVDLYRENGEAYVRVVDYKTGKKEFRLSDVLQGLNLQMLLYLAAVSGNGAARYGARPHPAGVLYMPSAEPQITGSRGMGAKRAKAERDKALRMNGLVLDDPDVLRAMEEKGEGKFIPVTLKDGEPARRDNVATPAELESVLSHVCRMVEEMARELHEGHIEAEPVSGGTDACLWCPYGAVCGHEKDDPTRPLEKLTKAQAMEQIREEEAHGKAMDPGTD